MNYDYALGGRQEHGADGTATDADLTGNFPITVTDATGDKATGSIDVTVHDDVPVVTQAAEGMPRKPRTTRPTARCPAASGSASELTALRTLP